MKVIAKTLLTVTFLFLAIETFSQQGNNWYFGFYSGITLNRTLQNTQYGNPSAIGYHGRIENPENKIKIAIITIASKE